VTVSRCRKADVLTIFVVDDRGDCRRPLARLLKSKGYEPVCLSNGGEALTALGESSPALILLDISMPVMDGLTFLSLLRGDRRWKSVPVIVLSGESSDGPLKWARELGANDVLVKSAFSASHLFDSIRRHLAAPDQEVSSHKDTPETASRTE
jgi:chemosensory pili system protein ChpA (sensor histidine kinase/response regulator)